MTPERILITGSSGFCGQATIEQLRRRWPSASLLGIDLVRPRTTSLHRFEYCDITSPQLREIVANFAPDTILHFAFVVNPMRDERKMHEVNVTGSRNLFEAAAAAKVANLHVSSSATAYGAWPDNMTPMTENHPLRTRSNNRYSDDKVQVEAMLDQFSLEHPEILVNWTRPCIVYGPGVHNYLTEMLTRSPLLVLPSGADTELQFVHLEDVANATIAILESRLRGPFNVAPSDRVTIRGIADLSNRVAIPVPLILLQAITTIWWKLRFPIYYFPASFWNFVRHSWVISSDRLLGETDFSFKNSSHDVLKQMLVDAGRLKKK